MAIQDRRKREKVEMRQTILDAAKDIAAADGWQNVTIRKICDKIHYSAPVVYQYFESKEMLLQSLRKEGILQMHAVIRSIHQKEKDPRKQLEEYGLAFWKFALKHPELYQVMFNLQGVICCEEGKVSPLEDLQSIYTEAMGRINPSANKSKKQMLYLLDYYIALIHGLISMNMVKKLKSGPGSGQSVLKESLHHFVRSLENNKS